MVTSSEQKADGLRAAVPTKFDGVSIIIASVLNEDPRQEIKHFLPELTQLSSAFPIRTKLGQASATRSSSVVLKCFLP